MNQEPTEQEIIRAAMAALGRRKSKAKSDSSAKNGKLFGGRKRAEWKLVIPLTDTKEIVVGVFTAAQLEKKFNVTNPVEGMVVPMKRGREAVLAVR